MDNVLLCGCGCGESVPPPYRDRGGTPHRFVYVSKHHRDRALYARLAANPQRYQRKVQMQRLAAARRAAP